MVGILKRSSPADPDHRSRQCGIPGPPAAFLCKLRSLSRVEAARHEKPPDPLDPPEEESRPVERSALCQMGDEG